MSWTLDIAIILIVGITIFLAAKNGFVKTLISALTLVVAIGMTALYSEPLAETIKTLPVAERIETVTEEQITDILLMGSHEIDELIQGGSEDFNMLLSIAGIDRAELANWYESNIGNGENAEQQLAKRISEPIIDTVALLIAILVLYLGTRIILSIISFLLDKIAQLPVLNFCNKLLGIILGVILAFVKVCLFCFIVNILIENSAFLGNDIIENLKPENTLIFRLFYEIDIFSFLYTLRG